MSQFKSCVGALVNEITTSKLWSGKLTFIRNHTFMYFSSTHLSVYVYIFTIPEQFLFIMQDNTAKNY